jgi:hypothetical protein
LAASRAARRCVIEVFVHAEVAVQRRQFRQVTDGGLGGARVFEQIVPGDRDASRARRQIAGEHLHGGGFSCAVRAEKSQHLALAHGEADVIHGLQCPVGAGQARDNQQRFAVHGVKKGCCRIRMIGRHSTQPRRICQFDDGAKAVRGLGRICHLTDNQCQWFCLIRRPSG